MKRNAFTPEEIQVLRDNPNTFKVTEYLFSFTKEAKEKILEMSNSGMSARAILINLGYDPDIFGESRYKNFVWSIRHEAESEAGIHQGNFRRNKQRMSLDQIAELEETPKSFAKLKNEVIYLREEVEFLKKISQRVISGKRGK